MIGIAFPDKARNCMQSLCYNGLKYSVHITCYSSSNSPLVAHYVL